MRTVCCVVLAICALALSTVASSHAIAAEHDNSWLFVSDVHYDVLAKPEATPNVYAGDTNPQLLDSFLQEAKRVAPSPPVVVIAGDFIAHEARRADSAKTMGYLAARFRATFPNAQFLFTLGNNDSACGDYAPPIDGDFLKAVASSWEPLVDKRGAAPYFARSFAHDGSYVARLPIPNLRAVVINDNFFTVRYAAKCAPKDAPAGELASLRAALFAGPARTRNWVLFHVPPGVDAFSTSHLTHGLVVVPFLRPRSREELTGIIGDKRARVALAIAGHTHKFAFRVIPGGSSGGVPMLLVPSVSPIFKNFPSFLTAPVAADGTLGDVVSYGYDGREWSRLGDLAELGVPHFVAPALRRLQTELLDGSKGRELFATLYEGGGDSEISARTWNVYACAATHLTDRSYDACADRGGYSVLTRRGLLAAGTLIIVAALVFGAIYVRDRRRRAVNRAPRVEESLR